MQIEISREKLSKYSVFCATPMYGGMCHGMYMKDCLSLQSILAQFGVGFNLSILLNESLIQRARNYLADEYLNRTTATHLLFLDADVSFNANDVLAMLALDKDIICGPYPKKAINWANVKEAILKDPSISPENLQKLTGQFVFNAAPSGNNTFSVSEPLEVMEGGTGFMLIKREVFEKFRDAFPGQHYLPDHVGQAHFGGEREIVAFFDCVIDPQSRRYLSEDYYFCRRCQELGIKIWLAPWVETAHNGTYSFNGSLPFLAATLGHL